MDESHPSESESLSGSGGARPEYVTKKTFNAGEYTGEHSLIISTRTSTEPEYPPIRRKRTPKRRVFLMMAMVGLFIIAVLAGVAVLWGINAETTPAEPHLKKYHASTTSRRPQQN